MRKMIQKIYEVLVIVLVFVTIATIWADTPYNSTINWTVWLVFFIDFSVRFLTASKKWQFVKENPFLLIAITPFDQFFQMARVVRLIHLFRIKTITKFYIVPYANKLTFQAKMTIITTGLIVLAAFALVIWQLEKAVHTYLLAAYVVVRHLFFLGHQHFSIENPVSIGALTLTSITGIVIQGLVLQWALPSWIRGSSIEKHRILNSKRTRDRCKR